MGTTDWRILLYENHIRSSCPERYRQLDEAPPPILPQGGHVLTCTFLLLCKKWSINDKRREGESWGGDKVLA